MQQTWQDLLFLHYKVPYDVLRKNVPKSLILDTFEGECWVSISPFSMKDVKLRWFPPIPSAFRFLELNLRTYVIYKGRPGIYFFSLDISSWIATIGARMAYLPYFNASMNMDKNGGFHFQSQRKHRDKAVFNVDYIPVESSKSAQKTELEAWLVERYCLFQERKKGEIIEIGIHHLPWQLQKAQYEIKENTLTQSAGFLLPVQQPLVHYCQELQVIIWRPVMR